MSERATSSPAKPVAKEDQEQPVKQVQLQTETTSNFEIGLDDPLSPKVINIEVELIVVMKAPDQEKSLVEYQAKHQATFQILGSTGFSNWEDVPEEALAPYVAMTHDRAVRKAEITLYEMGLRGSGLPRPQNFSNEE